MISYDPYDKKRIRGVAPGSQARDELDFNTRYELSALIDEMMGLDLVDRAAYVRKIGEIMQPYAERLATERAIAAMQQAKSRVLRRTEIPKDARNPTRDATVILGEHIADIIQGDIDTLSATLTGKAE